MNPNQISVLESVVRVGGKYRFVEIALVSQMVVQMGIIVGSVIEHGQSSESEEHEQQYKTSGQLKISLLAISVYVF